MFRVRGRVPPLRVYVVTPPGLGTIRQQEIDRGSDVLLASVGGAALLEEPEKLK